MVNLLIKLQRELNLTYLFISHDLSMVRHISDRIGVMYLCSLVELSASNQIYHNPLHPYIKALMSAVPVADPDYNPSENRIKLQGEISSPINQPPGCKFQKRCPYAKNICFREYPELREAEKGHFVACHLLEKQK